MLNEDQKVLIKELRTAEKQVERLLKQLGLVTTSGGASKLSGTTRQALIQLANKGRLTRVKLLENVLGTKAPAFYLKSEIRERVRAQNA